MKTRLTPATGAAGSIPNTAQIERSAPTAAAKDVKKIEQGDRVGGGEPLSETWKGRDLPTGGGATWASGSYDVASGVLYWAVGNPFPATNGDQRGGSNLYTASVLAIDPKAGTVKWHFQFTPHDLHDWDANEPLVLALP